MVGSNLKWIIKKLLGYPVSCEPNEGCGFKETELNEWLVLAKRRVIICKPLKKLEKVEVKQGYGFLDLIQQLFRIIRKVWLMIGNEWNGKDGARWWPGIFCSEILAMKLGRPSPWNTLPVDLLRVQAEPDLAYMYEFETVKK